MTATLSAVEVPVRLGRTSHVARGMLAGLAATAIVVLARSAGLLEGWLGLLVLGVALLAIPVSREFSRRIVVTGCIVLGWLPLVWWFPWPSWGIGHATVLLAAVVGALVGWVTGGADVGQRVATLVPRVRPVDAIPLIAAVGAAAVVLPWLTVPDADGALSLLLSGWDHSAHYDIVQMLRKHGAVIGVLGPAPLGDTWSYRAYPQGFHAVAATVMEVQAGAQAGAQPLGRPEEVLLYARTLGMLSVVTTTVLAAGFCAVPFLRRRPWAALPAVILSVGGVLLGPAGFALNDGFPNFALAVVLLACLPLLVLPIDRVVSPVHLAAIGGAIVGIAHGWVLLLSIALPVVAALGLPLRRRRFAARPTRRRLADVIGVLTVVGAGAALLMVARQPVTEVLTVPGAITAPPVKYLVSPAILAIVVCLVTAWRPPWAGPRRRSDVRVVAMAAVALIAVAVAGGIAALQLRAGLVLGYYFWKYAIGMAAFSIVLAALAVARLVPPRVHHASPVAWAGALVIGLGATQIYGVTVVQPDASWASPALEARSRLARAVASPAPFAASLWAAVESDPAPGGRHVLLLPAEVTGVHPATAGQWYNAVTGRWTDEANEELLKLLVPMTTVAERAGVAADVLTADPEAVVVVLPTDHAPVAELLPEELRTRLVSW